MVESTLVATLNPCLLRTVAAPPVCKDGLCSTGSAIRPCFESWLFSNGVIERLVFQNELFYILYGCFLKWWYPTTMGFPTQNDHFGVFWGYHHFRKPPYTYLYTVFCFQKSPATLEKCLGTAGRVVLNVCPEGHLLINKAGEWRMINMEL